MVQGTNTVKGATGSGSGRCGRIAVGLLALLLFGTACRPRQVDDSVHLVLAVPADRLTRQMYRDIVSDFEKNHPRIQVEILEIPGQYYSKVLVMIAGNNAPDLMWMGQSFAEFAVRGVFLDLSERIQRDIDLAEYLPQAVSWYRIDGHQYGIPFGIDMDFIAYNKALFDERHVAYPTDDWTYEEFLQKAKALTLDRNDDGRIDQYGFRGSLEKSAFGAAVISADGTTPLCNSPDMIRYHHVMIDLAEKWRVAPLPEDADAQSLDSLTYFQQGRAAMMTMYTWDLPFLVKKCAGMQWDIVNMPREKQRGQWASSQAILVAAATPHPDEAWLLCREFLADKVQMRMAARGLPPNLRVAREYMARRTGPPANWAALYKARNSLYPTPRIPNLSEIMSLYYSASSGISAHRATPEEAMQKAEEAILLYMRRKKRHAH